MSKFKEYLGDGVYADFDGYHIWLSTLEGMSIALEPEVYGALVGYVSKLADKIAESQRFDTREGDEPHDLMGA